MTENLRQFFSAIEGSWSGPYSLWLHPGATAEESDSSASVRVLVHGKVALLEYEWVRSGEAVAGAFFFSGVGRVAVARWGDSFHTPPATMDGEGELDPAASKMTLNSRYSAGPGGPEWGWRTEMTAGSDDTLLMEAYNIAPDGQEAIAVRAQWSR